MLTLTSLLPSLHHHGSTLIVHTQQKLLDRLGDTPDPILSRQKLQQHLSPYHSQLSRETDEQSLLLWPQKLRTGDWQVNTGISIYLQHETPAKTLSG
jgi:hypothetical protein